MFARIAAFELRYQVKNPVFWVAAILFGLLAFGSVTSADIQIGGGGNVHKNAAVAMAQVMVVLSLFFMFVSTAFVAGAIVRDDETGFGPIVRATRMTKAAYVFGRFTGAFLAGALVLLVVPLGIFLGTLMPWVDPQTLGPNRLADYAFAFGFIGLPAAFLVSALLFALTTVTRSMMGAYIGAVALFLGWAVAGATLGRREENRRLFAWLEPFGSGALRNVTQYWTAAERNTLIPAFTGPLLWGRVLWVGVALAILVLAWALFRFEVRGAKRSRVEAAPEAASAATAAALPVPRYAAARGAQFRARFRLECAQIFRSPAFFVLVALGMLNAVSNLWFVSESYGTQILPVTRVMIATLQGFTVFALIVAIYYGGELVWRERDKRTHEIIDSTPLPDWAFVVPKVLALSGVLVSTLAFSVLAALIVQTIKGYTHYELGKYLMWYVLPGAYDVTLIAILSIFVQSLVPAKPIGWAIMLVYIIASIVLGTFGFEHNLYFYGGHPEIPYSDMNGRGRFWEGALAFRLYWGSFAALLLVLAYALWRRGTETRLRPRLARLPSRLRGGAGMIAAMAALAFVGLGAWDYYNADVLNEYRPKPRVEDYQAEMERTLLRFEAVPQPTVTNVKLDVALFPHDRHVLTHGVFTLVNRTSTPMGEVHVRADRDVHLSQIDLPGARVAQAWPKFNYRVLKLDTPMAPGEARTLSWTAERWQHGFRNSGDERRVVDNGTFLNNDEYGPTIGMTRDVLLTDRTIRRAHGLPADLRMPKLGDPVALERNYIGARGWVRHSDITVTTDADQTPIAPGARVSDTVTNGRRTSRFVDTAPINNFFSIQSARYLEKHVRHAGIDLAVYYDAQHSDNVDRILRAMGDALDYYQANFAPYQFGYARIIEFPDYAQFAQAFAGTVPYSEGIGFIANFSDPDKIDYATYITAHELGHQYWGHQVVGADMQGATSLSETLAQYSALMVMEHRYGHDAMRRFLKYELDGYLRARGGERIEEVPLERVEANQGYIHYQKGSLAMYLLKERMGEAAVNRALRRVLAQYSFKDAPFPTSTALVRALRAEATPDVQPLITDLFQKIALWDLKVETAGAAKLPDGRYNVTMIVKARKLYADGQGKETDAPLDEPIPIGLFTNKPGNGSFDAKSVIMLKPVRLRSGETVLEFDVPRRPTWAGIDPYNTHITRNSADNLIALDDRYHIKGMPHEASLHVLGKQ